MKNCENEVNGMIAQIVFAIALGVLFSGRILGPYTSMVFTGALLCAIEAKFARIILFRQKLSLHVLVHTPLIWIVGLLLWAALLGIIGVHPIESVWLSLKMLIILASITFILNRSSEPTDDLLWFKAYTYIAFIMGLSIVILGPDTINLDVLYSNPNQLGQQMMFASFSSLSILVEPGSFRSRRNLRVVWWIFIMVVLLGALVKSHSRAALVGTICGLLSIFIIHHITEHLPGTFRRATKYIFVISILFVVGIIITLGTTENLSIYSIPINSTGRNLLWWQSLNIAKTHPLIGVGLGNAGSFLNLFGYPSNAHNVFLNALVELGIPGVTILIAFFINLLGYAFHVLPPYRELVLSCTIGLLVQQSFEATFMRLDLAFVFPIAATVLALTSRSRYSINH